MQKKVRNIFMLLGILFLCNIGNVSAKEIEKTCQYNTIEGSDRTINVLCHIYDNLTYACYYENGTTQATTSSASLTIGNWSDSGSLKYYTSMNDIEGKEPGVTFTVLDHYQNTGSCPAHLTLQPFSSDYVAWAVNSSTDVRKILNAELDPTKKWFTLNLNDPNADSKTHLANIKSAVEIIKEEYNFQTCSQYHRWDENTVKDLIHDDCIPQTEKLLENLNMQKIKLDELIEKKIVKRTDKEVKELNTLINDTKAYYETEKEKLNNMYKALRAGNDMDFALRVYSGEYRPVEPDKPTDPSKPGQCNLLGDTFGGMVKWVIDLIQIAIPVIIIIMTIVDFTGVVFSGEEKNFKAAGTKFVKRLVVGSIVILLPMLIAFLIDFSGVLVPYGIERDQLFCSLF